MKIGELNEHCGSCPLIDYCTEPYETPQLCTIGALKNIETSEYKLIAKEITEDEIADKLSQYDENNISPWSDEHNGAVCDIVLEKIYRKAGGKSE